MISKVRGRNLFYSVGTLKHNGVLGSYLTRFNSDVTFRQRCAFYWQCWGQTLSVQHCNNGICRSVEEYEIVGTMIDWLYLGSGPHGPNAPRPNTGPLCPISDQGSPEALLKLQMAPKLMLWISLGSKKKEPRYACLSEAKASHSQRMWAEVSCLTPHLLHSGLSSSPSR